MPQFTVAKIILSGLSVAALSQTAHAACAPGQTCMGWAEAPSSAAAPIIEPLSLPSTVTVADVSNMRVPGLANNERLCPTSCPVSVQNVGEGKVKACFKVCTPVAPAPIKTPVKHTVIYEPFEVKPVVKHHYVRVIRPVIYVHYPVPVAPPCRMNCSPSRYGY